MSYKFYNANARGNFVNDCTVRAISVAEGKSWDKTYEELSDIAQRNGIVFDDVRFIDPLLDSRYKRKCYDSKYVGEFAEEHPKGTYLITMNGHITCCKDGTIYDT
ncbi:MAG: hypothetical protein IKA31_05135, partial [Clostridia bacterium]|nr:hypothetical protein [Clostridia bacterium]